MTDIQLYFKGWLGIITNFWPVFIFFIASIIRLWRWEKDEKQRVEKAIKRDKLKRSNYQKHVI